MPRPMKLPRAHRARRRAVGVRCGSAPSRLQRQVGLGAVEGLDLAHLVDREDNRIRRPVNVKPDDVARHSARTSDREQLEPPHPIRLEAVAASATVPIRHDRFQSEVIRGAGGDADSLVNAAELHFAEPQGIQFQVLPSSLVH